jgi:hypothetical protein
MIKDRCIDCKHKESNKEHEKQKPFEHLYCAECYSKKAWLSKFKEGTGEWIRVMFERNKK